MMTLNISEKFRGCLGISSNCFSTHASVIRKIEILKKILVPSAFLLKNLNFKVIEENQDDLEHF